MPGCALQRSIHAAHELALRMRQCFHGREYHAAVSYASVPRKRLAMAARGRFHRSRAAVPAFRADAAVLASDLLALLEHFPDDVPLLFFGNAALDHLKRHPVAGRDAKDLSDNLSFANSDGAPAFASALFPHWHRASGLHPPRLLRHCMESTWTYALPLSRRARQFHTGNQKQRIFRPEFADFRGLLLIRNTRAPGSRSRECGCGRASEN